MTTSVLLSVRLPHETRTLFAQYCEQAGVSVSEAVRRMIEFAIERKTIDPSDDVWDIIGKGQLPAGVKNRFALLPELTKGLPPKDYDGEEPWNVRPENEWKTREVF